MLLCPVPCAESALCGLRRGENVELEPRGNRSLDANSWSKLPLQIPLQFQSAERGSLQTKCFPSICNFQERRRSRSAPPHRLEAAELCQGASRMVTQIARQGRHEGPQSPLRLTVPPASERLRSPCGPCPSVRRGTAERTCGLVPDSCPRAERWCQRNKHLVCLGLVRLGRQGGKWTEVKCVV